MKSVYISKFSMRHKQRLENSAAAPSGEAASSRRFGDQI